MRLTNKISLILLSVIALLFSIGAAVDLYAEKRILGELLMDRGRLIARSVSIYCIETLLTEDYPVLNSFLEETARENPEIISIDVFRDEKLVTSWRSGGDAEGELLFESDVTLGGEEGESSVVLGSVTLRLSDERNRKIIGERLRAMVLSAVAGYVLLFLILNIVFRKLIIDKILLLGRQAVKIGEGDLRSRIELPAGDELGSLAGELNDMSEKLFRYEQELIRARHDAEAANRLKGEFIANMSHEIRTPLNSVIGFSSLLESLVRDEKQRTYIAAVKASGKGLIKLVDDILDISRMEADKLEILPEPVVLANFFRELEQMFRPKAVAEGIGFYLEIAGNVPPMPVVDERRLRQVMVNLVGNALKFTDSGEVKVRVWKENTDIHRNTVDLLISVKDTGRGISPGLREEIFEPFSQGDSRTTREHGGVGLGLSITRRLVEMMHGSVTLESEEGKGSVFTVRLRRVPLEPGTKIPAREKGSTVQAAPSDHSGDAVSANQQAPATNRSSIDKQDRASVDKQAPANNRTSVDRQTADNSRASISQQARGGEAGRAEEGSPVPGGSPDAGDSRMENGFAHDPEERAERLGELREILEKEMLPLHRQLTGALELERVEAFALRLKELGRAYGSAGLSGYAGELASAVENIDVVGVEEGLEAFPELVRGIGS